VVQGARWDRGLSPDSIQRPDTQLSRRRELSDHLLQLTIGVAVYAVQFEEGCSGKVRKGELRSRREEAKRETEEGAGEEGRG
jgi:hypothetical protein